MEVEEEEEQAVRRIVYVNMGVSGVKRGVGRVRVWRTGRHSTRRGAHHATDGVASTATVSATDGGWVKRAREDCFDTEARRVG